MKRLPAWLLGVLLLGACRASGVELRGEVRTGDDEYLGRPLPSGSFWIEFNDRDGRRRLQEVQFHECRWTARVPENSQLMFSSLRCGGRARRLEPMARLDARDAGRRGPIVLEVVPSWRIHRPGEFCAMPVELDIIHPVPSFAGRELVVVPASADSIPVRDGR
jgi:hypothetical protein